MAVFVCVIISGLEPTILYLIPIYSTTILFVHLLLQYFIPQLRVTIILKKITSKNKR